MNTESRMNPDTSRAPVSQKPQVIHPHSNEGDVGALVRVNIDDQEIKVPLGTTILEAAKRLGIHIPTLCHHADLCSAGLCRVCVVEVEGMRTLQASCAYPISSPMTIKTHTRKVRNARRHIVDLLLSEHVGECYTCFRNNNCELQSLSKEMGVTHFRFGQRTEHHHKPDNSSYSVVRDMDKCVLCRRCVRTCIDLQEVGVLEACHRGSETAIETFHDKPLGEVVCINCGQCINRCPTGALRANDPSDEIWDAMRMSDMVQQGDSTNTDTHDRIRRDTLVDWLAWLVTDNGYRLMRDNDRGFANEYTVILVSPDADPDDIGDDWDILTPEQWADDYLYNGDAATEAYNTCLVM